MAIKVSVKNDDFWDSLEMVIDDPQTGYQKKIKGYTNIHQYFQSEVNFWQPLASKSGAGPLNQLADWLQNELSVIEGLKNNVITDEPGKTKTKAELDSIAKAINVPGKNANSQHYLPSKTDEAKRITSLVSYSPNAVEGAFKFYANDPLPNTNREMYVGYMQAVALEAEKRNIGTPADHQRASFDAVRNDVEAYKTKVEEWHETSIESVDEQFRNAEKKIVELEGTYGEKLKLQDPAKYWGTRAKKYWKQGNWWLGALAGTVLLSVIGFTIILLQKEIPLIGPLFNVNKTISIDSLRGILLLLATISFTAYLVRLLGKMMLSAYHLQRDAEEREQLTVVYLALKKDASVEEADRKIILQSLFSRVDTGLVGADRGPTMPFAALFDKTKGSG